MKRRVLNRSQIYLLSGISLAILALLLYVLTKLPLTSGTEAEGDESLNSPLEADLLWQESDAPRVIPLETGLVKMDHHQFMMASFEGRENARHVCDLLEPVGKSWGAVALVADRQGSELYLCQADKMLYEARLDGRLAGADYAAGYLALIDEIPDGKPRVQLLNPEGQRIFTLSFDESGYPVALSFTPDKQFLDILLLNADGARLKTILKRYNLKGNLLAQRIPDQYEEFFYGLAHDAEGHPLIWSPRHFLVLDYEQDQLRFEAEFADIKAVLADDSGACSLVAADVKNGRLAIRDYENEHLSEAVDYVGNLNQACLQGNTLLLAAGTELTVYDRSRHQILEAYSLPANILRLLMIDERQTAIVSAQGFKKLRVR